jgi:glycosyltransferase involved in cell wall biosynthesis
MFSASTRLSRVHADIFHIVDGSQAHIAKWLLHLKSLATAHDVIPLLQSMRRLGNGPPRRTGQWVIQNSINELRSVKHVIAVSHNTARDLDRFANIDPNRISVVHSAIPPEITSQADHFPPVLWKDRRESQQAYVLHVSNNAFYKNPIGGLRIFARILAFCDVRLIMGGSEPDSELQQVVRDLKLSKRITFVVNPDDEELADLYRHASLFLFPSLYEGFGWPPLEAMAFGCPVVCSSAASLPEVVGDAALTCVPENEEKMADNCLSVLQDRSVANRLIEKGYEQIKDFSLERMGSQIMAVYEKVLSQ